MIESFKSFQVFDTINECYDSIYDLSTEELDALEKEVGLWTLADMSESVRVLKKYYSLEVPVDFLKKIFVKNIDLAYENFTQGIGDTCQRDLLISAVLKEMNMRPWPIYGEGDEVFKKFIEELKVEAKRQDIVFFS